jgi:hypothetical protein
MASTVAHIPPPQDNSEIPDQQCAAGSLLVRVQDNMGDTRLVSRSNFIPPPGSRRGCFPLQGSRVCCCRPTHRSSL